jgi:hypothetical protein
MQNGTVIYLHAVPEMLRERTRRSRHRPLLNAADPMARLAELYAVRDSLYREVATSVVESNRDEIARFARELETSLGEPLQVVVPSDTESSEQRAASHHVRTFLEMVVLGTTMQLAAYLRDAIYIGPLRAIPPRGFLYERAGRITSWADGLAAWDLLLSDRLSLVDRTNSWLRRLHTECQVVVQQLFDQGADAEDLSEGLVDDRVRRLLLETATGARVLPAEVGAGISQVVPVIIGALQVRPGGISLIEQPEIHVHPAVQVGFGDLFLDAVTQDGGRRTLVVETHSEHLLLRVMRRLRETAEDRLPEGWKPVHPSDVMVLFVERDSERTIVRQMPLNERGELVKAWPGGFFEEGLKEAF